MHRNSQTWWRRVWGSLQANLNLQANLTLQANLNVQLQLCNGTCWMSATTCGFPHAPAHHLNTIFAIKSCPTGTSSCCQDVSATAPDAPQPLCPQARSVQGLLSDAWQGRPTHAGDCIQLPFLHPLSETCQQPLPPAAPISHNHHSSDPSSHYSQHLHCLQGPARTHHKLCPRISHKRCCRHRVQAFDPIVAKHPSKLVARWESTQLGGDCYRCASFISIIP